MLGQFGATSLALGDIDGDGDLDVFIGKSTFGDLTPTLYLNDGQGNFAVVDRGLLTRGTREVTLADLNGDGALDATIDGVIYLNDGEGNFSPNQFELTADQSYSPGYGDIDADGDLDVLFSNRIELNRGDGQFELRSEQIGTVSATTSLLSDVEDPARLRLLRSAMAIGAAVGLEMTAEAVETEPQRTLLLSVGCMAGQGTLLAPVMSSDELESFLAASLA